MEEQRRPVTRVLRDSSRLNVVINEVLVDAYGDAILRAVKETDLSRNTFPTTCPFTADQVLDESFLPND